MKKTLMLCILLVWSSCAWSQSNVATNGYQLSYEELIALQLQLGVQIPAGNYEVDYQTGCWANLSTGQSNCGASNSEYVGRSGSGSYDTQGNWNHYNSVSGFGVGGTSDGCIYTTSGWSNC